jgi:iron complex outermembrane receptor protein
MSLSTQATWNFTSDQAVLMRYTFSQRAPSVEELYSYGNHEATATFNVGNPSLNKESSNHFELGYRKNKGLLQGKLNLYQSYVNNYIYTQYTGAEDLESDFPVRQYLQSNAILKGVESEITYNLNGDGFSGRFFGDYSEGNLNQGGYLPLQPATRIGSSLNFNRFSWKSQLSWIHAFGQNKTASSPFYNEPSTDGYNKVDFRLSKTQAFNKLLLTYYLQANNLLNDTIRFSTTVETIRANAPQPGRSLIVGLKLDY